jgi:nucleotide-binding universal stress UspA family protein
MDQHRHTHSLDRPCLECAVERARELKLDRILVPLDGTPASEFALPYAAMVSRWLRAELTLFHVVHPGPPFHFYRPGLVRYPDALHDRANLLASAYLTEIVTRLTAKGLRARWGVATGDAAQLIPSRASDGGYGLIVMAVRPRAPSRRRFSPGVLERMWRHVATPTLFLHERRVAGDNSDPPAPGEFVVPMGGDPSAGEVTPYAAALAGASGARVTLLASLVTKRRQQSELRASDGGSGTQSPLARMQEMAAHLREDRISVQTEMRAGIPAWAIVSRQAEAPRSWVVMTSFMPAGLSRTVFGSTADGVLRTARGPVLVVPEARVARKRAEALRLTIQDAPLPGAGR